MFRQASKARWAAVLIVAAATLAAGCGSGDSTVAKTPQPEVEAAPTSESVTAPETSAAPEADPCAVNLAAPAIAEAVSSLPKDPRSNQGWSSEPVAGNYNECAQLSAVIVEANTNAEQPSTRAVLFHQGKFIPTGVPDTFGFNGIDTEQSTGDTVALKYSSGLPGLDSVVKFRWNGEAVELISNAPR